MLSVMNLISKPTRLVFLCVLLLCGCQAPHSSEKFRSEAARWEYKTLWVTGNFNEASASFNELAKDGWVVVSASAGDGNNYYVAVLKRRLN